MIEALHVPDEYRSAPLRLRHAPQPRRSCAEAPRGRPACGVHLADDHGDPGDSKLALDAFAVEPPKGPALEVLLPHGTADHLAEAHPHLARHGFGARAFGDQQEVIA